MDTVAMWRMTLKTEITKTELSTVLEEAAGSVTCKKGFIPSFISKAIRETHQLINDLFAFVSMFPPISNCLVNMLSLKDSFNNLSARYNHFLIRLASIFDYIHNQLSQILSVCETYFGSHKSFRFSGETPFNSGPFFKLSRNMDTFNQVNFPEASLLISYTTSTQIVSPVSFQTIYYRKTSMEKVVCPRKKLMTKRDYSVLINFRDRQLQIVQAFSFLLLSSGVMADKLVRKPKILTITLFHFS